MSVDRIGEPLRKFRLEVLVGAFHLAADLSRAGDILFDAALLRVYADWDRQVVNGTVSAIIVRQYTVNMRALGRYAAALGYTHLDQIDSPLLRQWMAAPKQDGADPSLSLRRARLQAARGMFATAILLGLHDLNAAQAISMPLSKTRYVHAFTDSQVRQLQETAAYRLRQEPDGRTEPESKAPAALALMLLGATSAETSRVTASDVNLADRRVWIGKSGRRTRARWLPVDDDWCLTALQDRVRAVARERSSGDPRPLCYDGAGNGSAAVATMLATLMKQARVYQAGVSRTESLRDACALRVFAQTGRIEDVAARLGLFSLDIAAHIVGYDWVAATDTAPAPTVEEQV